MGAQNISLCQDALKESLRLLIPLKAFGPGVEEAYETHLDMVVDNLSDLAKAYAEHELDREFNRGDWGR